MDVLEIYREFLQKRGKGFTTWHRWGLGQRRKNIVLLGNYRNRETISVPSAGPEAPGCSMQFRLLQTVQAPTLHILRRSFIKGAWVSLL